MVAIQAREANSPRITEELLAKAVHLQVIGRAGSGLDNIDLNAAIRHGVLVVHAPRDNEIAVAEHTMAMLLALTRHIPAATSSIKAVAQRAQAFGMRVIASDPFVSSKQVQLRE